jgi:hypothetical protein
VAGGWMMAASGTTALGTAVVGLDDGGGDVARQAGRGRSGETKG